MFNRLINKIKYRKYHKAVEAIDSAVYTDKRKQPRTAERKAQQSAAMKKYWASKKENK